jgi:hypothetical protein
MGMNLRLVEGTSPDCFYMGKRLYLLFIFWMIAQNVDDIRRRIERACRKVGRLPSEVTLVAVSKTFPAEWIREVVSAGVVDLGENYVQELLEKKEQLNDENIRWHFIGHLQSNKVKYIARWVHLIHTVDSLALAREIDRHARRVERIVDVLIEVNTTGEHTKFGVTPERTVELAEGIKPLPNIRLCGLMTMGPFLPDPEGSRPIFHTLRRLKERVEGEIGAAVSHLSMGMTGDFEVAIEEGATILRVGTAIFGPRKQQTKQSMQ